MPETVSLGERRGTIDEILNIKAAAGYVEVHIKGVLEDTNLRIPARAIDAIVERLEAARDAAALMAGAKATP